MPPPPGTATHGVASDVHTADTTGCLHCTHGLTTATDWLVFIAAMREHHGVVVGAEHMPLRLR